MEAHLSAALQRPTTIPKDGYGFATPNHALFPPMVVVSIINACNLKCVHCFSPKYMAMPDYNRKEMPWEVWTKVIDEMSKHPWSTLNLGTDGEPMMHKKFVEMLRYAKTKSIYPINITTNGTLLRPKLYEPILQEELLHVVNISLDAASDETYKKVRGGDLKRVRENVLGFIDRRNELQSPLKIQVNIIDQPESTDEIQAFKEFWEPRVDNVLYRTYYDATSITGKPGPNITGRQKEFPKVKRWPCQLFWRRITVTEDGTMTFCIDDWLNKSKVGHVAESTIAEVWQSAVYEKLREQHLGGLFHEISFCADCTEWQGMDWNYDYFTAMEKMLDKKLL